MAAEPLSVMMSLDTVLDAISSPLGPGLPPRGGGGSSLLSLGLRALVRREREEGRRWGSSNGQIVPEAAAALMGNWELSGSFRSVLEMDGSIGGSARWWHFEVDRAGAPNGRLWVGHRTKLRVPQFLSFFLARLITPNQIPRTYHFVPSKKNAR
jgi:hypothetical protein